MEKKIKQLLIEIEKTTLLKVQAPIIPEEYLKILNSSEETDNLNCLNKMNLEELKNNNEKCIKCNRIANYKNQNNETLLCWNHSIE